MPTDDEPNFRLRRFLVAALTAFILLVAIGVPTAILAPVPQAEASVSAASAATTTPAEP